MESSQHEHEHQPEQPAIDQALIRWVERIEGDDRSREARKSISSSSPPR
jgi:hypothetical protein